jgi:hypothetical protein
VDITRGSLSDETMARFRTALSDETYEFVTLGGQSDDNPLTVHMRFKIVEWWQNRHAPQPAEVIHIAGAGE